MQRRGCACGVNVVDRGVHIYGVERFRRRMRKTRRRRRQCAEQRTLCEAALDRRSPQVVRWAWGMRMTPEPGRIHQLGRQTAHLIACRRLIERYAVPGVLDYKQVSVLLRLSRG